MNEDDAIRGCAPALVISGFLWVVILVVAAVIVSRVLP
jgi:hypothetical protein